MFVVLNGGLMQFRRTSVGVAALVGVVGAQAVLQTLVESVLSTEQGQSSEAGEAVMSMVQVGGPMPLEDHGVVEVPVVQVGVVVQEEEPRPAALGGAGRPERRNARECQAFGKTRISCHSVFWPSLDSQIAVSESRPT